MRQLLVPLFLSSLLCAQAVTSPIGLDTTEGNAAFAHFSGTRRFMSIDNTHAGTPLVIRQLGFRRNGGVTQPSGVARTMNLTVDLGLADFGNLTNEFDGNYQPGSRTNVFTQTAVNFPDWTANLGAPAPFDFFVPLANPHVYLGTSALVIDFSYSNVSVSSGLSVDRDFGGSASPGATGAAIGTGCVATGGNAPFSHTAALYNHNATPYPSHSMRLRVGGAAAPANSPVLLFVDALDPAISGVLCADIHALPRLLFVLAADAGGAVIDRYYGFGYDASLVGATFYTQLFAIDPGQGPIPLVVSNGRSTVMPGSSFTAAHAACYGWNTLPNTNVLSSLFFGGTMVIQLGL
jgi:hypothetical protein